MNPITYRGRPILFVDCEASSLDQRSYPIEIGWAPVAHAGDGLAAASVLVRPTAEWQEHGIWAADSALVHGIEREALDRDGLAVEEAVRRVDEAFQGCILVSDMPDSDMRWLRQLFYAAGRTFSGRLHDLDVIRHAIAVERGLDTQSAFGALEAAEATHPRPHRAGADALRMAQLTQVMIAAREVNRIA